MHNLYQTRKVTAPRLRKQHKKMQNCFQFLTNKDKGIWESYGAISSLTEILRQRCN